MKRRRSFSTWSISAVLMGLLSATIISGVGGLQNVAVTIPAAVKPGDTVSLQCQYDLEKDPLYTVKWYKGRQEFFRYIPKELPHTRVFPMAGINVDVSKSGANEVVLRDVQLSMAGKYRCEVSTDAPDFHTKVVSSYMHVVYLPEGKPNLTIEKHRYAVGEYLRVNCSSPPANPPTNLTWYINGKRMNETFHSRTIIDDDIKPSPNTDSSIDPSLQRQVTVIGLEMEIEGSSFPYGKLRIECRATVFKLYNSNVELILEEERPRLASVLGTRENSKGTSMTACSLLIILSLLVTFFQR